MNKSPITLLLVEDDPNFGAVLKDYLQMHEMDVILARDGAEGMRFFKEAEPDLCILDVMMPKKDGFTLAGDIRNLDREVPIIFLTAKSLKEDMLRGYQTGADDYLTKPFDSEVLLYKIKALLHRTLPVEQEETLFSIGKYQFNAETRVLQLGAEEQTLSPKESALLKLLAQNKNRLVERSAALKKIWKDDNYFTGRSMDVYIARLRKYLSQDEKLSIVNVHSQGFRLIDPLAH